MHPKPKILVCESDHKAQLHLRSVLSGHGYAVESAQDGHETIDKINTLDYDLLLIASNAMGIDGFQVCRLVKENDRTRHIPAMIISSMTDHVTRNRAIEAGADEFITKPINRVELLARVVTLLRIKSLHDRLETLIMEKEEEKRKLAERTDELRILSEIARIVISVKDQKGVLREIVNKIREAFGVEGSFMVTREASQWVFEILSDQLSHAQEGRPAGAEQVLFDHVAAHEKPVIIHRQSNDGLLPPSLSVVLGVPVESLLCSPIFVRGKVVGLLHIVNKQGGESFDASDLSLLMTISGQIALAIENMQLFARLSDFNKTLQTEIAEATQALVDLKNFNESILQNVSSGLMTVDFAGKILFANWASQSIFGYSTSELLGRHVRDLFGEEAARALLRPTDEIDNAPGNAEVQMSTKDGRPIYVGYTTTVRFDSRNEMAGYIISFRDITQIKEMRVTIARMDRLVSLGMVTSAIAHEIRNPLAGIKTMAQALEKEIGSKDPRQEYVQRIVKQINRLNELLKAFFSYARPVRPEKKYYGFPGIVKEVKTLLKERCENERIQIEEYYDPNLPPLFVDENQIEQVLINLLINAMDAIEQSGRITIEAQLVTRTLPPRYKIEKEMAEVRITDTGRGIAGENLKSIFDPFFTTKANGIGLGLSIVYRIVHEHGGEVYVASEEGKGTTFTIVLPLHDDFEPVRVSDRFM